MPGSDVHSSSILLLSGWAPGVNSCFSHICRRTTQSFCRSCTSCTSCMYLYVLCRCCRSCTSHLNAFKEWNISRPPKNPPFHPTNRTGSFSPSHNVLENDPRRHVEDVATPTPPGERPSTRRAPGIPGHPWPHRPATMGTMGEAVCSARSWLKNPTGVRSKKRQVSGNVARIIFQWHRQGTKWKCRPTKAFHVRLMKLKNFKLQITSNFEPFCNTFSSLRLSVSCRHSLALLHTKLMDLCWLRPLGHAGQMTRWTSTPLQFQ